jgi:hypothetical protein
MRRIPALVFPNHCLFVLPDQHRSVRDALEIERSFTSSTHRVKIREFSGSQGKITPVYTPIAAVRAVFKGFCRLGTGQRVGIGK